ncbi:DUF2242 domain-containing protein [Ottowia sp.]|uniref:DUF2242 domain-containing protein n=1 Tax=Ottowia sp. TaxID=1898956 RepID=UPI003A87B6CE
MSIQVHGWRVGPLVVAVALLTGCTLPNRATPLINYQPEAFDARAYARHYDARAARSCEAARRALLSQGYIVSAATADQVSARKYFQPFADHHVQLEFRVVCATEGGGHGSMVFVNGLKEQYMVRKAKESASVGVGGIGSLSLPLEGGMDSMVKVGSETVTDARLYERFFDLLGEYLANAVGEGDVPEPAASAASAAQPVRADQPAPPTVVIVQPGPWGMLPGPASGASDVASALGAASPSGLPLGNAVVLPTGAGWLAAPAPTPASSAPASAASAPASVLTPASAPSLPLMPASAAAAQGS